MKPDLHDVIDNFRREIQSRYVTIDRFSPIEKVVYGGVGLILFTVLSAFLLFIINNKP